MRLGNLIGLWQFLDVGRSVISAGSVAVRQCDIFFRMRKKTSLYSFAIAVPFSSKQRG